MIENGFGRVLGRAGMIGLGLLAGFQGIEVARAAPPATPSPSDRSSQAGAEPERLVVPPSEYTSRPELPPLRLAQASGGAAPAQPVGQPPPEQDERPVIATALDVGGVLTPQGMLVVEPSFTYSHSGVNRFTFRGTELVETVLVGIVEAEDADRDFLETALTLRYGITDRLEIETRVPGVYRSDRVSTTTDVGGDGEGDHAIVDELDAFGLGDVEVAAHYQLNRGRDRWPYFVGNLRAKFPTGQGPFDVDRDPSGVETELPTGSGFYAVEPSLTVIWPTDPVVIYGNVGYLWNIARDIDQDIGTARVGRVDPGDSIRFGFGMSLALNEAMSLSLGYSQDLIDGTKTQLNGVSTEAEELTVGQISIGVSHRLNERMSIDLGTTFGVTEDATDVSIGVRLPIRFQLF